MMQVTFTLAPELRSLPKPIAILVDISENVEHMVFGGKNDLCTVSGDQHTLEGHLADIWEDMKQLFPYAAVVALIAAVVIVFRASAQGAITPNVSNPVSNAPVVVPSQSSVVPSATLVPTNVPAGTFTPTATSEPTLIPLTATPTVAPTETAIWFTTFTPEQCDLRSDYSSDFTAKTTETQWYLVKLIPYLRGLGYHGQNGDGFFVASVDEVRVILTLVYKKDPNTPQIALPQEMWGSLPTNRFCMISGNWTPLSPFFGDVPIQ